MILVMIHYVLLHSVTLLQMDLWSKFDESVSFDHSLIGPSATGDFYSMFIDA